MVRSSEELEAGKCALLTPLGPPATPARGTHARVTVRPGHFFKTEPHVSVYRFVLSYLIVTYIMSYYVKHFHINILYIL